MGKVVFLDGDDITLIMKVMVSVAKTSTAWVPWCVDRTTVRVTASTGQTSFISETCFSSDDCCEAPRSPLCKGEDTCCTARTQCGLGEGSRGIYFF